MGFMYKHVYILLFIKRGNNLIKEKLVCFVYLKRKDLVMNYLVFVCLNFHSGVTQFIHVPYLIYIGKRRHQIKLSFICSLNRNNLVVKAFLLKYLLFGHLFILNIFQ